MTPASLAMCRSLHTITSHPSSSNAFPAMCRAMFHSSVACAGPTPLEQEAAHRKAVNEATAAQGNAPVTWDEYFKLRKQRRMVSSLFTWPATILTGGGAGTFLATNGVPFEFAGLDPMLLSGLGVLVGAGSGLLIGPAIGSTFWAWANRAKAQSIAQKDKAFFDHVRHNRVNPSMQSVQNPIPDFYGERIGSLHEYRQWLRDQNTYRRKVAYGVKEDEL